MPSISMAWDQGDARTGPLMTTLRPTDAGDSLAVLRDTPAVVARRVREHDPAVLRARPFEGKWTPNEILGHLLDHEIVSMCRIRTMRLEAVAWISPYDQERWVTVQRHKDRDPQELVRRFTDLRSLNLEQYESLSHEEWCSRRERASGGDISLEEFAGRHAGHDLHHLDQLGRYLDAAVPDDP